MVMYYKTTFGKLFLGLVQFNQKAAALYKSVSM